VSKLYLDGCSYTYGLGLPESQRLQSMFEDAGYEVTNLSRPGKSNTAIVLDTFNNINNFDRFVLGFTYSSRYYVKFRNIDIDLIGTRFELDKSDQVEIEDAYTELHKAFYTLYDNQYWDNVSDMLIDNLLANIKLQSKKVFPFSWETRKITNQLFYPVMLPRDRLLDGHLNAVGTQKLFNQIQQNLGNA
jgi:hypothetical protein